MRSRRWVLFATCSVTATLAVSQAIAAPPAGAGKPTIDPRIEIFRAPRAVATGRKVSADAPVPVIVELATAPSHTDLAALQAAGVVIARDSRGAPIGREALVTGRMAPSASSRVAALGLVRAVRFDGPPVRTPRPLDLTTSLISADAT